MCLLLPFLAVPAPALPTPTPRRFVVKGWLSAIMLTFDAYPRAGLVGPLFVGEGDLVTEAGGIIFADAAAANYGRGREPHYSMYYMRPADYISAACVVFPKHLYKKIGGFDPQVGRGRSWPTWAGLAGKGCRPCPCSFPCCSC